jgi:hypothetical protein
MGLDVGPHAHGYQRRRDLLADTFPQPTSYIVKRRRAEIEIHNMLSLVDSVSDIQNEHRVDGRTCVGGMPGFPLEDVPPRRAAVRRVNLRKVVPRAVVEVGIGLGLEPTE